MSQRRSRVDGVSHFSHKRASFTESLLLVRSDDGHSASSPIQPSYQSCMRCLRNATSSGIFSLSSLKKGSPSSIHEHHTAPYSYDYFLPQSWLLPLRHLHPPSLPCMFSLKGMVIRSETSILRSSRPNGCDSLQHTEPKSLSHGRAACGRRLSNRPCTMLCNRQSTYTVGGISERIIELNFYHFWSND